MHPDHKAFREYLCRSRVAHTSRRGHIADSQASFKVASTIRSASVSFEYDWNNVKRHALLRTAFWSRTTFRRDEEQKKLAAKRLSTHPWAPSQVCEILRAALAHGHANELEHSKHDSFLTSFPKTGQGRRHCARLAAFLETPGENCNTGEKRKSCSLNVLIFIAHLPSACKSTNRAKNH